MTATLTAGTPPADTPALLDVQAVAHLLHCSTRHVRRLADGGRMPAPLRVGSLLRWRRTDLDVWLADGCRPIRAAGRAAR
jgi:excisionase family DNA binding protein